MITEPQRIDGDYQDIKWGIATLRIKSPADLTQQGFTAQDVTLVVYGNPTLSATGKTETGTSQFIMQMQEDRTSACRDVFKEGVIVEVPRVPGGWDVQNLQSLVGHLEGTAWFGDSGNTVLAGHFEDEVGRPGPFRYLYEAQVGDRIIIQSETMMVYEVQQVFSTAPDDLEVLRHTDAPRLTLITCDTWSYETKRYEERLVVVAVPLYQDAPTTTPNLSNGVN
ncbi:MAG: class F sortase [Anaerolineae bacterium]|nr:MAG: class F sortase [Anaerolineae bacterium]